MASEDNPSNKNSTHKIRSVLKFPYENKIEEISWGHMNEGTKYDGSFHNYRLLLLINGKAIVTFENIYATRNTAQYEQKN